jgi:hypothetical protein
MNLRLPRETDIPILCDFGEARFGMETYTDDIQPYDYRAPELKSDILWTCNVCLHYMAEMVALLGLPPLDFTLQRDGDIVEILGILVAN